MMRLDDFKAARNVLKGILNDTGLIYSQFFSKATGNYVYLKPENMQVTGAYKIRGAYYTISTLSEEEKAAGLITASAGNHAQGVAFAAHSHGIPATIVMPTTTPLVKVNNTKDLGAKVILHGEVFDESAELAAKLSNALDDELLRPRGGHLLLPPGMVIVNLNKIIQGVFRLLRMGKPQRQLQQAAFLGIGPRYAQLAQHSVSGLLHGNALHENGPSHAA